ncbi:hypothetical protein D3C78_1557140 [compost metagenome]
MHGVQLRDSRFLHTGTSMPLWPPPPASCRPNTTNLSLHYHDCAQRQPPPPSNPIGEKALAAMPDMTASINGQSRESLSGRFGLILAMLFVRFINAHISLLIATSPRIGLVTWICFQGMPPPFQNSATSGQ